MRKGFLWTIVLVFLVAVPLQAAPMLSIVDSPTAGVIADLGQNNQILSVVFGWGQGGGSPWAQYQLGGWFGGNLWLDGPANITISLIGWEAAATNTFTYNYEGGGSMTWTTAPAPNSYDPPIVLAVPITDTVTGGDYVDFSFGTASGDLDNGSNQGENSYPNFFVSFVDPATGPFVSPGSGPSQGTAAWIFLDDDAGLDNHDDLAIKISVSEVPIPAAAWLLGVGLVGIVGIRRKISKR